MILSSSRLFLSLLLLCASLVPFPVRAEAPAGIWSIEEITGSVQFKDATGQGIQGAGKELTSPLTVQTGADGRLVLGHGGDRVTIGPGSRFEIPEPQAADGGFIDRVIQAVGSMLYQIEHRMTGGFEVETPYLVSVVKGTTFNILVTADASTVALIEGRLALHTPDGRSQLILESGQAAIKSRHDNHILLKDQQSLTTPMTGPIRVVDGTSGDGEIRGTIGVGTIDIDTALGADGGVVETLPSSSTAPISVDAALRIDSAPIVDIDDGGVSVSETAISVDADVPGVDVGTASVGIGQTSIDLGATPQIDVSAVTVDVGATSVGELGIGATSLDLGEIVISSDAAAAPMIDVSETSVQVGEISLGDVSTPTLGLDTSLSVDTSGGAAAAIDLDLGDAPVASLDVSGADIAIDLAPEEVVTTITDTVSGTANTAVNIIKGLPGL